MTKNKKSPSKRPAPEPAETRVEETPFEAVASICSVLVVGMFILTFIAQNFAIPSGSMENTLLVGDHLVGDRITLPPPASWMPLVHYREPHRGDIVVFLKPVFQPGLDQLDGDGKPIYTILVKRLIGVPMALPRLGTRYVLLFNHPDTGWPRPPLHSPSVPAASASGQDICTRHDADVN